MLCLFFLLTFMSVNKVRLRVLYQPSNPITFASITKHLIVIFNPSLPPLKQHGARVPYRTSKVVKPHHHHHHHHPTA
ncbi:hypothetical protein B9Z19DRAFT_775380 [Tuber borchii]|uniref:Secreted protein n=1 Tax=Tuber borchii TaxID=42251 RepID=A0A2T6ZWX3_TUBBO|nr:hypothetical protein B9Z19DRAFT_775380 [Tuber borchii]